MRRIFKYKLPIDGGTITINAHVITWLNVGVQNGEPYVWALVDEEGDSFQTEITAWGTGWEFPDEFLYMSYLGTIQDGYGYVWHYFMRIKNSLSVIEK